MRNIRIVSLLLWPKMSDFLFADSSWKTLLHLIKLLPSFIFFMVVRATVPHSLFTFIFYVSMINGRCRTVEWASISEGEIIISLADAGPSNGASGWKNYPIGSWRRPKTFTDMLWNTRWIKCPFPAKKALPNRSQNYVRRKLSILNVLEHN